LKHKRKRYVLSILITLLIVSVISCSDDTVTPRVPTEPVAIVLTPMWPQSGYNAQNTSSPYAPYAHCNPVNLGEVDWFYDFGGYNSDGAEFCVDSKNNIYFLWQGYPRHKIYKFRPDGTVIWIKDSVFSDNFASFSLSPDEKKIYMSNGTELLCIDSIGHLQWSSPISCHHTKSAIGKDGTIYTLNGENIVALNPDGSIKWTVVAGSNLLGGAKVALDKDENAYFALTTIVKVDKNGILKWTFTPAEVPFYTQGVVIDGFNNIYFINYFNSSQQPGFYSLSKEGTLRWKRYTTSESPPVIDFRNTIYTVGSDIRAYDTSGNIVLEKPLPPGVDLGDHPVMDDERNIYFLYDIFAIKAASVTSKGELRWTVDLSTGALLPGPSLMPMGRMLVAPKRAGKIACIK
jgi:hypothetical protein